MTWNGKPVSTAETINQKQLHFQGPEGADAVPNESVHGAYPQFNTWIYEI